MNEYVYAIFVPSGETSGANGPLYAGRIGFVLYAVVIGLLSSRPVRLSRWKLMPRWATIVPLSACEGQSNVPVCGTRRFTRPSGLAIPILPPFS